MAADLWHTDDNGSSLAEADLLPRADTEPETANDVLLLTGPALARPDDPEAPSSIMAEAGGDPVRELDLVDQCLRTIGYVRRQSDRRETVARWAINRATSYLRRVTEQRDRTVSWYEERLRTWREYRGEPGRGRSYDLPSGRVGLRKKPQRVKVVEAAVLALADTEAGAWLYTEGIVRLVPEVDGAAVRKRFRIEAGRVVDVTTGEIVSEVSYYGDDGQALVGPLLVEVEPAHDVLSYEITPEAETRVLREETEHE